MNADELTKVETIAAEMADKLLHAGFSAFETRIAVHHWMLAYGGNPLVQASGRARDVEKCRGQARSPGPVFEHTTWYQMAKAGDVGAELVIQRRGAK